MTVRPLPRSRLGNLIPSLLEAQALVALVPATGDLKWAAAAAWDVARAAAQHGRRVALVDLWLEAPLLHHIAELSPSEGIAEAFASGDSLTKAAHEIDHVFFIPAGSGVARPGDLFGHPRWPKLHGGFQAEGALLLLYLSVSALARLSTLPDGLIVLSPDGFEPESSIGQGIAAAIEGGIPLLGVVRERWTPGSGSAPNVWAPASRPRTAPRRRARSLVIVALLVAGAAGSWRLLARGATPRPVVSPAHPPAVPTERRVDSVPWTVQLATFGTLGKALAFADRLEADDLAAFVTPIALESRTGGGGTVWYRVLVGAYPTHDSAAAARAALWRRGVAPGGEGDLLRAPYSLALTETTDPDSLRARGIPAVRWAAAGGYLVGAFETPEQASLTEAQLKGAGIQTTLVTRMGFTP